MRRSSPLRFFPRMSNFLRDQMVSKGLSLGALTFMATTSGPDLVFLFFFLLFVFWLVLGSRLDDVFAIEEAGEAAYRFRVYDDRIIISV